MTRMTWLIVALAAALLAVLPALALEPDTAAPAEVGGKVEAVFVLDTTGSMGGLIEGAKQKIWSIANTIATAQPAPEIKMGLVAYRDRGDTYITKQTDLKDDLDAVYTDLMHFQAGGGGDGPESVNQALNEAVTKFTWSKDETVYKVIFLVGDYPPHMDYQDDVKYQDTCKTAATNGIIINTIQCGNYGDTQPVWSEIARLAEGKYFQIAQTGGVTIASTPFDAKLAELSTSLDHTRAYYGSAEAKAAGTARATGGTALGVAAPTAAAADRAVFNAGAAGARNFAGANELITDIANGTVKLADMKEADLPENMQKMTPEERQKYVDEQVDQRKALTTEIADLAKQRQEFILAEQKRLGDPAKAAFDLVVLDAIKEQGSKHNLNYVAPEAPTPAPDVVPAP
jgi:Mg-chelatase subunit ChlD